MLTEDFIAVLRDEGTRLAEVAERAGLGTKVPSAPGWRVRDLLSHTGRVYRWARSYLVTGDERRRPIDGDGEPPPVPDAELPAWLRAGHAALVDALEAADPALTCWTFLPGATSPRAFWARRQAHETAVHRVDAEQALAGAATPPRDAFPADFAADGIDELLAGFFGRRRGDLLAPEPVALAVRCADVDAGWTIRIGPHGREITCTADDGADCRITGAASDLYLFLWNRQDADRLDVKGEAAVLGLWRALARIR
ncbi:MAG: maleylpyruvate isomerase family mycothiol-dependent enzyme [Frankia sp.]|nr:maleylpyruvate isomerase family mycothiol-dependent enzyme [Frankia sp.]